jgi:hypothetical protein
VTRATMIPSDRFFARLHRFECECPSCGRMIETIEDGRRAPGRFRDVSRNRARAKQRPGSPSVRALVWNPHTQGLRCPWCETRFTAGLLLFPNANARPIPTSPPSDTTVTRRQRMELRGRGGGWHPQLRYAEGDEVNLVIIRPCGCPAYEWGQDCPVHGSVLHPVVRKPDPPKP